ncbi:MAG: tRNA (adenosine(37)-N6)-dimethylallyltransferase [Candidatus Improbicoccus devescovinae]|nr:MAG: tRNA (adenosine(37)-N6)-dimethylallyltransferase [Candidatus Improbicoccus devescovinae]
MINNKIIVILGPTSTGKTDLGFKIAEKLNTEIISADSIQVYKELNICSNKPSEYMLNCIRHYFINYVSVSEAYNSALFTRDANIILSKFLRECKIPIIVGGTGLYISALLNNFKFDACDFKYNYFSKLKLNSVKHDFLKIGLNYLDRQVLYQKINDRVDKMIQNGLVEEVKFVKNNYKISQPASSAIGFKEITEYLDHQVCLDEYIELIKKNTRNYAKRQITWFKREPNVKWFFLDSSESMEKLDELIEFLC